MRNLNFKPIVLLITVCIVFLVILDNTRSSYAWFFSQTSRSNNVSGVDLNTMINEDYDYIYNLIPDKSYVKSIRVLNTGNCDALVRISLSEVFINFEIDPSTGNIKTITDSSEHIIDLNDIDSYENAENGNVIHVATADNLELYNVINNVFKSNNTMISSDTTRESNISEKIELIWNDSLGNDWIFEDGYFYYTKVLMKGTQTTPLLDKIKLKAMNNEDKGSIYKLIAKQDSLTTTEDALTGLTSGGWGLIEDSSNVLPILKELISDK